MKIAIGSDHAGYDLKTKIIEYLKNQHYEVLDCGAKSADVSVDYPNYAEIVAAKVSSGEYPNGILICGTGIGMCIAANKISGIRAALVWNQKTAILSREHNNANILCLGGRTTDPHDAIEFVKLWLNTQFAGGRHERRIEEISALEKTPLKKNV